MKDLNDSVGNRTRDLPPWKAVPLPSEPYICEILSEEVCIKVIINLELSDTHQLQQQYLTAWTLPMHKTLPSLFRIHRAASKETPKVRVRLLLHPVDTFISMAVTSFYLRSSLQTATHNVVMAALYITTDCTGPGNSGLALHSQCQVISYLQPLQQA